MGLRRKYLPIGNEKFKAYHEMYDSLRLKSNVLAGLGASIGMDTFVDFNKLSIEKELLIREGDENGVYYRFNEITKAQLPGLNDELEKIRKEFNSHVQGLLNTGKISRDFDREKLWEQDEKLFEQKLKLEARIDIVTEEIRVLNKLLQTITDKEAEDEELQVLKNGLVGAGKVKGGVLVEIDGQTIDIIDQRLIITSNTSPYKGMEVPDYHELVKKYKAVAWQIAGIRKQVNKRLGSQGYSSREIHQECMVQEAKFLNEHPEYKKLFGLNFRGKKIPVYPRELKNYLALAKEKV